MEIEIWSDSFHEGDWCCDNISNTLKKKHYTYSKQYDKGFIPRYTIRDNNGKEIKLVVYGSYSSWNGLPKEIEKLISWGRPDIVAYDPEQEKILFAVEETAATLTGNQSVQRCERQFGAAMLQIPYWYLGSEYTTHTDGNVRKDSIWPSLSAMKLTIQYKTPSLVLHYSNRDNTNDYNSGNGLEFLFDSLATIIENVHNKQSLFMNMEELLKNQYKEMQKYIGEQWDSIVDYIQINSILSDEETCDSLTHLAMGCTNCKDNHFRERFRIGPLLSNTDFNPAPTSSSLIKEDSLAYLLEKDIDKKKCYTLSKNAGSGQPPTEEKIKEWIGIQRSLFNTKDLKPQASFTMDIKDFPSTYKGNRHITTSKNIVYLYDKWADLKKTICSVYPRLKCKFKDINNNQPILLYVCNSLKPGRFLGDPFTGQISAYSTCLGRFDNRVVFVYCPHQVHTQVFDHNGDIKQSKGTTIYKELTDYLIFHGGVAVSLRKKVIL